MWPGRSRQGMAVVAESEPPGPMAVRVTGWPLAPQALNGPANGTLRLVDPMVRVAEVASAVTQSNSCGVPVPALQMSVADPSGAGVNSRTTSAAAGGRVVVVVVVAWVTAGGAGGGGGGGGGSGTAGVGASGAPVVGAMSATGSTGCVVGGVPARGSMVTVVGAADVDVSLVDVVVGAAALAVHGIDRRAVVGLNGDRQQDHRDRGHPGECDQRPPQRSASRHGCRITGRRVTSGRRGALDVRRRRRDPLRVEVFDHPGAQHDGNGQDRSGTEQLLRRYQCGTSVLTLDAGASVPLDDLEDRHVELGVGCEQPGQFAARRSTAPEQHERADGIAELLAHPEQQLVGVVRGDAEFVGDLGRRQPVAQVQVEQARLAFAERHRSSADQAVAVGATQ